MAFLKKFMATAALVFVFQNPLAVGFLSRPAFSQTATEAAVSEEVTAKLNTYVEFLNRTLRASESLERYDSWVDMKKGPTGKERIIYGLYSLYDVRDEASAAIAATQAVPKMPELDAAMAAYVETYQQLAPVIERANKYYERQDYKSDKMEAGKGFHKEIAALAPTFEERRKTVDAALRTEKVKADLASLAALEQSEGKKSRWHVRNVMFRAEAVMDLMPTNDHPVVKMTDFKRALDDYSGAVREFDDYALEHPDSFHVFESQPASLLSKLRDFDEKLEKAKGDARKGAGEDLQWLVSDYNTMVSTAQTATTFAKD
ncbi:YiiG family protein [Agrobacterium rosae]|uniref:YiiG family protein n=1 Tax=Agrobacterium rosae TaxID=1972867 RepID=A0AAW9FJG9_9HYPH|nr:YiiG family protein [Agrobacterium rosae]MDX8305990.1 YiiG family protein [Agrobacterium rosae]